MKVKSFRVRSFRSIDDSGWQDFSPDQVTVLVGQNESGKSSILEALHLAGVDCPRTNVSDIRVDGGLPSVEILASVEDGELHEMLEERSQSFIDLAKRAFQMSGNEFRLKTQYKRDAQQYRTISSLEAPTILPGMSDELRATLSEENRSERGALEKDLHDFVVELALWLPYFSLFRETAASLPDTIDLAIDGEEPIKGQKGAAGARNFVSAAGLDLKSLLVMDDRHRGTRLRKANEKLNEELAKYWTQYFGEASRIQIECEYALRPAGHERPGNPYLTFWVSEGAERFYPSQRSRGTQWFVAVFLHLLATEAGQENFVIMLDEPGSFLHAKAQNDVRRLIERIAESCQVIYSTHSPELVDFEKPYRILAVERSGSGQLADTKIFRALNLACASQETLTPILMKMGADLRHQTVIKTSGNVILEEPSALFYLRAFDLLTGAGGADLSFVAASGVNNVPTLFALMTAWGLKFCILTDDDKQARRVRAELVKNYFGGDDLLAAKTLLRLRDMDGVEDMLSREEFVDVILEGGYQVSQDLPNSALAKAWKVNKAMVAYRFFVRAEKGEVTSKDFSSETLERFGKLVQELRRASMT